MIVKRVRIAHMRLLTIQPGALLTNLVLPNLLPNPYVHGHMPAKWRAIPALGLQTDVRTQLCCVVCAMRNALRNSNGRPIALQLPVY